MQKKKKSKADRNEMEHRYGTMYRYAVILITIDNRVVLKSRNETMSWQAWYIGHRVVASKLGRDYDWTRNMLQIY